MVTALQEVRRLVVLVQHLDLEAGESRQRVPVILLGLQPRKGAGGGAVLSFQILVESL